MGPGGRGRLSTATVGVQCRRFLLTSILGRALSHRGVEKLTDSSSPNNGFIDHRENPTAEVRPGREARGGDRRDASTKMSWPERVYRRSIVGRRGAARAHATSTRSGTATSGSRQMGGMSMTRPQRYLESASRELLHVVPGIEPRWTKRGGVRTAFSLFTGHLSPSRRFAGFRLTL